MILFLVREYDGERTTRRFTSCTRKCNSNDTLERCVRGRENKQLRELPGRYQSPNQREQTLQCDRQAALQLWAANSQCARNFAMVEVYGHSGSVHIRQGERAARCACVGTIGRHFITYQHEHNSFARYMKTRPLFKSLDASSSYHGFDLTWVCAHSSAPAVRRRLRLCTTVQSSRGSLFRCTKPLLRYNRRERSPFPAAPSLRAWCQENLR